MLQWVPSLITGVMPLLSPLVDFGSLASMGPQSDNRGYVRRWAEAATVNGLLQWVPSLITGVMVVRKEDRADSSALQWVPSLITGVMALGAGTWRNRNDKLQWVPSLITGVMRPRPFRLGRRFAGFNGSPV